MSRARVRSRVLAVLLVVAGGAVIGRLFQLQVVQAEHWRAQRDRNPRAREWLEPRRGRITDRLGRVLAEDEPRFRLQLRYRGLRRGHPLGLLVHADHYVRALRDELRGGAPPPVVAGGPLRFADDPARHLHALDGVLGLAARWVHRDGPLERRLRGVLRFYVFSLLAGHGPYTSMQKLASAFDTRWRSAPETTVVDAVAELLGEDAMSLRDATRGRLLDGLRDLDTLGRLLGELELRGRPSRDGARGGLLEAIDALDQWLERHTDRVFERAKAEVAEREDAGFWRRLRDAFLARGDVLVREPGFEERLDLRFRHETAAFDISRRVPFDTVIALVLGKRERFSGFEVVEHMHRIYPRRERGERPYRFLGAVREEIVPKDEVPVRRLIPVGEELDVDLDGVERVNLANVEWWRWREQLIEEARRRGRLERRCGLPGTGVESALDEVLAGRTGVRELLKDRLGREKHSPRHVPADSGLDVQLTIDADLQDVALLALEWAADRLRAEAAGRDPPPGLEEIRASLAVIDARSGAIRAMTWLPETTTLPGGNEVPFWVNTTARAWYQTYPGSLVKPPIAYEALARGIADGGFEPCSGRYKVSCDCRIRGVHIDATQAIEYSCNTWFAQVGERLEMPGIIAALRRFGLWAPGGDAQTPYGLDVEDPGPVAGESWSIVHRVIGYGYEMAPLRIARAYAGLGSGRLPPLRYADTIGGAEVLREPTGDLRLAKGPIATVREGLRRVPLMHGTARHAGLGDFDVAGKTGTAEVRHGDRNNVWFAGYVPSAAPRLAFCCVFWDAPSKVHGGDAPAGAIAELLRRMRAGDLQERYFGAEGK